MVETNLMSEKVVRVGFLKVGNIGTSTLIELLLDERAERKDIDVRVVTTGAKMTVDGAEEAAKELLRFNPDFVVVSSPNAALPAPKKAREVLAEAGVPTVVVSDYPARKAIPELEEKGFGYIIVQADSMIGARREFLDPAEMALFNADVIKVLAATGAFNVVFMELDRVISQIKAGEKPELPRVVVNRETAVRAAGFSNPYAQAKARAAYEIASRVAAVSSEACFKVQEWTLYTSLCATAHEMMHVAAMLADEAREIEKYGDTVFRRPHHSDGTVLSKVKLFEKPKRP